MSYLTKYGTLWGAVPEGAGRVHWVAPSTSVIVDGRTFGASNDNDGMSPERPVSSIQQAITNAVASAGEVIMLMPGTHTSAATVTLNKADLTFVACHPQVKRGAHRSYSIGSKVNWTSTFAGAGITNTAADCTFVGINFIPVTAQSMMTLVGASRNSFIDCSLTMSAAASTSTKGFVASGTNAFLNFSNCVFLDSVATSAQGPCLDLTGAANFQVDHCTVLCTGTSSAWAVAIQLGAGSSGVFQENFIGSQNAGTITIGIDGTGVIVANAVNLIENHYGVSPGAGATKSFDNTDVSLVNNFYGTIGGGAGFVIHTVAI